MRISQDCWQCEYGECGHIWIAANDVAPAQCARCKKRGWHTEGAVAPAKKPAPLLPLAKTDAGRELVATFRRHGKLTTDVVGTAGAKVEVAVPEAESKPITNLLGIGGVAVGSDPRYARPAHAPGCKCFSCCPPKGEK